MNGRQSLVSCRHAAIAFVFEPRQELRYKLPWDDVKTYEPVTTDAENVIFNGTSDFIKFIEDSSSIFFERGWLEIKS